MKEIFKTLKKYSLSILLMIIFIIIQAMLDLKLPDYTSDIVNIGIQQNGIKTTAIKAIRESEYQNISIFMNEEEQKIFYKNYKLIEKGNKEYIDDYEILGSENIYVLTGKEKNVENILNKPLAITKMLSSLNIKDFNEYFNLKLNINESTTFFEIYNSMHQSIKEEIIKEINKKFEGVETSILNQSAIEYIKDEYKVIGIDLEEIQTNYIFITGIKMLSVALLSMVVIVATIFTSSRMAAGFTKDLRKKIVNKVLKFSNKEYEDFSTSSLITRSTNDINQIQMFLMMGFRTLIYAPIIGIGAYLKVSQNEMGWIIGIAVLLIIIIVGTLFVVAMPKFQRVQELIDKLNLVFRETLSGLPVIRAFSNEKYEEKKFDVANTNLMKVNRFVNNIMSIMMPAMSFIMNAVCVLILWVGADKVNIGTTQVGNLIAFMTYAIQIIISFLMISIMSIMIPRAFISFKRIKEVLNTESCINEIQNPERFDKSKRGLIEFKDVYFRYPDATEDVIQNISFIAEPGKTTAFIGSTGSGKSTLINLIPRFFDVTSGKILIDGINIRNCSLKDLRSKIGYVPQKGLLFSGDINSNINFGLDKNLSKKEIEDIAKISQSYDFISEKKDNFKTKISQGGTNVSGGQRQRLAIARALAVNPDIYIFDDSFSALDFKTDARLRKELKSRTKNKTVLIVAQRISTIMNADQIIVLDEGEIVGKGTHKDLLKNCKVYQEIVYSQLGKEEV